MAQKLPKDSIVLVTGANGYLASHIIDQLLQAKYRVRGTVRDKTRSAWLASYFNQKYGPGRFEMVQVQDVTKAGCYDGGGDDVQITNDISAFAHLASDLSGNPDPAVSVTPVVDSVLHALEAASQQPTCKSFVLTSSSVAAVTSQPNKEYHISVDSWNEAAIKEAFTPPHLNTPTKRWASYGASKALGEQAAWKYIREHKPHFTFNTILPNANFGPIIDPSHQGGSASGWIRGIYTPGAMAQLVEFVNPQWFVHTTDTALLHVACLTNLTLQGERLLAFGEPFSWNDILKILRKLTPDKELPPDLEVDDRDLSTVDNGRALQVLMEYCNNSGGVDDGDGGGLQQQQQPPLRDGEKGWLSLEQGLTDLVRSIF